MFKILSEPSDKYLIRKGTAQKVSKIKNLLQKALAEVQIINGRFKHLSSTYGKSTKSQQSSQCQQINQILFNLKKGYLFNKYSQNHIYPRTKFIYLSEDNRYICWKSMDKNDQKRMELHSISKTIKEGAEFHIKSNLINDIKCCLVIFGEQRKLIVESKDEIQIEYFHYELQRAIKYSRSLKLNYKYIKH